MKHIPPRTSERTHNVTRRIAEQLAGYSYPDLTPSDMDTMRDTGGYNVTHEVQDPPQHVQDKIAARAKAIREWHRENDKYEDEPVEVRVIHSEVFGGRGEDG